MRGTTRERASCSAMSTLKRACGGISVASYPAARERGACGNGARLCRALWPIGRPSIAPEKLLRAMLLQAFYSVRSERQLMERLEFDLLFRWFVGLGVDDAAWDHSAFSKNRDRLLEASSRPSSYRR